MPSPNPLPPGTPLTRPPFRWPTLDPTYPKAAPLGMLAVALAYFALGVAVGALVKESPRRRRWLPVLVVPGALAAIAYLVWVLRSLA